MDVIALARELGKAIQQDEKYIRLHSSQQATESDAELQQMIGDFDVKRVDLNAQLNKDQRDAAKISEIDKEVSQLYHKIMENPNMQEMNQAKAQMDEQMDFVLQILRGSINGQDPDAIEQSADCSGSCSSCSGCS